MVIFIIVAVAFLAIVTVIWSDASRRKDGEIDPEVEHRASRYEAFATVAADLRIELGREPSVREIYAAVESDEPDADQVVDLRSRVDRLVGDLSLPPTE